MIKEWWSNLADREKQTLSIGSVIAAIFLFYALIWSPLSNKVDNLRNQISANQKLLTWMQAADKRMQLVEKSAQKSTAKTQGSLLGIIQNNVNKSPVAKEVSQLQQTDSESVQLRFQHVNFDVLIEWLTQIWQQQGLVVSQATIMPNGAAGNVTAEVVLKIG